MQIDEHNFWSEAVAIWTSGGWLMIPLIALTIFIYHTALELFFGLHAHFLVRSGVYRMTDGEIATKVRQPGSLLAALVRVDALNPTEVRRHFEAVENEYLPAANRRIKFLGVLITIGPLMGLLGTVTGMLSTFNGMIASQATRFESVVEGISEALITTQTGLVISIPALVILSLIIQKRNTLRRSIARLERYNTCLILKVGCPIPKPGRVNWTQTTSVPAMAG
ncbi:MAG: MotA/TolQ/ExbB proton channel family protein [Verrucomicrobiia bacterium]